MSNKPTLTLNPPAPPASTPLAPAAPKKGLVSTKTGRLVHLFTNVHFTTEQKLHEIDAFVQAQVDAGKLVVQDL